MRTRSVAILVLSLAGLGAALGDAPAVAPTAEYMLWHTNQNEPWKYDGNPATRLQLIRDVDKLKPSKGSGKALLLRNGIYTVKTCSPEKCTLDEKKPENAVVNNDGWWAQATAGWKSLTAQPAFQLPMSRAAGWHDAVVVKQVDGTIDLKDVFSAARARLMNFELCSIETDQCVKGLSANWDGTAARLKEQQGLALGTYRLIALNGGNEAWIRVVNPDEYAQVKKAYEEAVAIIHTWSLPPDWDGAPSLDRLERMALAGVGHGH